MRKLFEAKHLVGTIFANITILSALISLFLSFWQALQVLVVIIVLFFLLRKYFKINRIIFITALVVFLYSITSDIFARHYLKKAELLAFQSNKDALSYFKKAVAVNPRNYLYRFGLVDFYTREQNYQAAVEQCVNALAFSPGNVNATVMLVSSFMNLGQLKEATQALNKLVNTRHKTYTYEQKCRIIQLHKQLLYRQQRESGLDEKAEGILSNLVGNGDFSLSFGDGEIPAGWVKSSLVLRAYLAGGQEGERIFKIENWRSNDTVQSYPFEIKNNVNYKVTLMLKIDITSGVFYLQWNAFTGRLSPLTYKTIASFASPVPQWKQMSFIISSAALPGDARYMNLMFKWYGCSQGECGTVYIKDVSVIETDNV